MALRAGRSGIQDGCAVDFDATVMGGAVVVPGATLLPLGMDVSLPRDAHRQFKQWVAERQIGRLYVWAPTTPRRR